MNHFFISVILSISGRKICTYAFIDSGATNSHISDSFVTRNSIPRRSLPNSIPITAIDGRPLASGFVSHEVYTPMYF
jgi:Retroviral aspartyl protease